MTVPAPPPPPMAAPFAAPWPPPLYRADDRPECRTDGAPLVFCVWLPSSRVPSLSTPTVSPLESRTVSIVPELIRAAFAEPDPIEARAISARPPTRRTPSLWRSCLPAQLRRIGRAARRDRRSGLRQPTSWWYQRTVKPPTRRVPAGIPNHQRRHDSPPARLTRRHPSSIRLVRGPGIGADHGDGVTEAVVLMLRVTRRLRPLSMG